MVSWEFIKQGGFSKKGIVKDLKIQSLFKNFLTNIKQTKKIISTLPPVFFNV